MGPIFLIMFTIGGSTGVILGSTIVDIGLHDTYYVVTHFHFVLSLGTVIGILTGSSFFQDYLLPTPSYLLDSTSSLQLFPQVMLLLFSSTTKTTTTGTLLINALLDTLIRTELIIRTTITDTLLRII